MEMDEKQTNREKLHQEMNRPSSEVEFKECVPPVSEEIKHEIALLFHEVFAQTYPSIPKDMDRCMETVNYWSKNWEKVILVYTKTDKKLAGFMVLGKEFLDELYIQTDFQGKGIGSLLISRAKEAYPRLGLYTMKQNQKAVSFYRKHGFEIKKYGIAPDEQVEDVYMEWEADDGNVRDIKPSR